MTKELYEGKMRKVLLPTDLAVFLMVWKGMDFKIASFNPEYNCGNKDVYLKGKYLFNIERGYQRQWKKLIEGNG